MQRERFWFGAALVAVPLFALVVANNLGGDLTHRGALEGHVCIHGHPMAGGTILFVSDDPQMYTAIGRIDEDGHYRIEPRQDRMEVNGETHFTICLIPPRFRSPSRTAGATPLRPVEVWNPAGGRSVILADATSIVPQHLYSPKTSSLGVQVGAQSMQVDISL